MQRRRFRAEDNKYISWILILSISLWPSFFVNKGLDVTDTGFLVTKYKYFFVDPQFSSLSTFLTDFIGACVYHLTPSHQFLALSVANWIVYLLVGFLFYKIFCAFTPKNTLLAIILIASLFTRRWYSTLGYNGVSVLIMSTGLYLTLLSVKRNNRKLLIAAGALLGAGTFARLPNITYVCLAVAIYWYYGFCQGNHKEALRRTSLFAGSALLAGAAMLALGVWHLGAETAFIGLGRVAEAGTNQDSTHNIGTMLGRILQSYKEGAINIVLVLIASAICGGALAGVQRLWYWLTGQQIRWKGIVFASFVTGATVAATLYKYADVYDYLAAIALLGLLMSAIGALLYRKVNPELSLLSAASFIMILVFPIGSDMITTLFAMAMYLPICIVLCLGIHMVKSGKYRLSGSTNLVFVPAMTVFLACVITLGAMYGYWVVDNYVYRDAPIPELRHTITGEVYAGVKTSQVKAQIIKNYIQEMAKYPGKPILSYGCFTIGSLVTDMPPFFDTAWPDLQSYSLARFAANLETNINSGRYPVIAIFDLDQTGEFRSYEKLNLIMRLVDQGGYEMSYQDEYFKVYARPEDLK